MALAVALAVALAEGVAVPVGLPDEVAGWLGVVEAEAPRDTVLGAVVEEEGEAVGLGL